MIKPGHSKFCHITVQGNIYTFHNLRDFVRTTEGKEQKQNWIEETFDISKLTGLEIYISPFAFHNLIGHTFLGFIFSDNKKILLSIEGEQKMGENYKLWKAIYPGYRTRYLWGTEKDTVGLRMYRKEKVYNFPVHIKHQSIHELFKEFVKNTNESKNHHKSYGLIFNNCTSSLRTVARHHLPIPKRNIGFAFNKFLPKFLHQLGVVKMKEKEIIKKI